MYAFILGNQNFQFDNIGRTRYNLENNRVENLEIEIRNKIEKVKNFNPESCFNFSDVEPHFSSTGLSPDSSQLSPSALPNESKEIKGTPHPLKMNDPSLKTSNIVGVNKTSKTILKYKNIIKWLDIIASVIIIVGCVISQIENQTFYDYNRQDRVNSVKLISDVYFNKTKNLREYNISKLSDEDFVKSLNLSDYSSIPVPMQVCEYCNLLRLIVFFSTLFAVPLIITSRYIEYRRDYLYKMKSEIPFYKTNLFTATIYEILMIVPFQYPNMNLYYCGLELGSFICFPLSSILSTLCFIRFYFLLKLFKHMTKWTSTRSEYVCEKYVCKADTEFAFKAFQKENPFIILFFIFILSCVCFGLALRSFELYYWENKSPHMSLYQNWDYAINAMWCIFLTMTTVGYGDFYPKTQIGRFIVIMAGLVGVYFVSMMMVFMTQKSILTENENKAFKIITRLKLRNEIKNIKANIVYRAIKMAIEKKKLNNGEISEQKFHINYNYHRRKITNENENCKEKIRMIQNFEFIPLKEQLFDISERIDSDIKEIKQELESLGFLNETLINFSDSQIEVAKYLKKNCFAIKMLYNTIEKQPVFGHLNNTDFSLKHVFETEVVANNEEIDMKYNLEDQGDTIFYHTNQPEQIKDFFEFIFAKNQFHIRNVATTKFSRTMNYVNKIKTMKIKKNSSIKKRSKLNKNVTSSFKPILHAAN